jgi:leader peptidase (prepilin peptidase)/N-methyltransferase
MIKAYDNIPVLSYLFLKGKCRYCKKPISPRYPLVEATNAVLYCLVLWRFGTGWSFLIYCFLCSCLTIITFIDIDFKIIPDEITLTGIPAGLIAGSFLLPDPFLRADVLGYKSSIIGASTGFLSYYLIAYLSIKLLKKEGMGGGDIKMMTMVGAFLGWKAVILTTFAGSLLGSIAGVALMVFMGRGRGYQMPFGPFLAFGTLISLLFGQDILLWYLY